MRVTIPRLPVGAVRGAVMSPLARLTVVSIAFRQSAESETGKSAEPDSELYGEDKPFPLTTKARFMLMDIAEAASAFGKKAGKNGNGARRWFWDSIAEHCRRQGVALSLHPEEFRPQNRLAAPSGNRPLVK